MKKYLQDLEKELKKLMMSKKEIDEILEDHKEMIETALNEGITEEELANKFGNPASVAKELKSDTVNFEEPQYDAIEDKQIEKGFELFKRFPMISDSYSVLVRLVSEDIKILIHDFESIEVYYKGNIEKHTCEFDNNELLLKKNKTVSFFTGKKSTQFIVYLPKDVQITNFSFSTTSGDALINGLKCDSTKVNAVSGDFELMNFQTGDASLQTVSGDIEISKTKFESVTLQSVSGDVELCNVVSMGELRMKTVSGDYELQNVKAGDASVKSVSGDCEGTEFYPKSVSLSSISGDIEIENSDKTIDINVIKCKSISGDISINGAKH